DRIPWYWHDAEMVASRYAGDAQRPVSDHDRLHAQGRFARTRYDVSHLHGADEPRLFVRSRPGQEAARFTRIAAGGDRTRPQLAAHGWKSERVPVVSIRDLA